MGSNGYRTETIPGVALDLPVYSWGDLLFNEFQAQLDLVEGLIQQVTGNIIAGPPSVGKTWLVLTLARAVASGGDWLGHFPTTQGTVLMVDEESHVPGLQSRARMLEEGNPLGRDLPSTSRSGTAHASTPTQAPRTWTP